MSEQDATDEQRPDGDGEELDDIATEPAGDPDETLADITDGSDAESGTGDGETGESGDEDALAELADRVAESDPEEIAREIDGLRSRVEQLEATVAEKDEEIDDLESRLKRKQADFQNYKKRQQERMEEEKQRATEDFVRRLLDVRDNLKRAVDQEEGVDIREGVETTLRQFDEQFERENVTPIEPESGEPVDHQRHEALATVASDQPEDTVAQLHRPGYEMAGKVIRPAQVAVSDGSEAGVDGSEAGADSDDPEE
jgi:molecular chaperone GrpE